MNKTAFAVTEVKSQERATFSKGQTPQQSLKMCFGDIRSLMAAPVRINLIKWDLRERAKSNVMPGTDHVLGVNGSSCSFMWLNCLAEQTFPGDECRHSGSLCFSRNVGTAAVSPCQSNLEAAFHSQNFCIFARALIALVLHSPPNARLGRSQKAMLIVFGTPVEETTGGLQSAPLKRKAVKGTQQFIIMKKTKTVVWSFSNAGVIFADNSWVYLQQNIVLYPLLLKGCANSGVCGRENLRGKWRGICFPSFSTKHSSALCGAKEFIAIHSVLLASTSLLPAEKCHKSAINHYHTTHKGDMCLCRNWAKGRITAAGFGVLGLRQVEVILG